MHAQHLVSTGSEPELPRTHFEVEFFCAIEVQIDLPTLVPTRPRVCPPAKCSGRSHVWASEASVIYCSELMSDCSPVRTAAQNCQSSKDGLSRYLSLFSGSRSLCASLSPKAKKRQLSGPVCISAAHQALADSCCPSLRWGWTSQITVLAGGGFPGGFSLACRWRPCHCVPTRPSFCALTSLVSPLLVRTPVRLDQGPAA